MVEVEDVKKIDEIVNSITVRVTGAQNETFFNQEDMVKVLSEISEEITNEDQREGFDFAIHFIRRMGE